MSRTDRETTAGLRRTGASACAVLAAGGLLLAGCTSTAPRIASAASVAVSPGVSSSGAPLSARQEYVHSKLIYAQCLRAAGIKVPDPDRNGDINNDPDVFSRHDGPSIQGGQRFLAQNPKVNRCVKLIKPLPEVYEPLTDHQFSDEENTAKCFRKHGVSQYPDPLRDTDPGHPDVARRNTLIGRLASLQAYQKYLNYCFTVAQGRALGKPKG